MYLFDLIKKWLQPKTITDIAFGRLRLISGWWVGNPMFEPTGKEVEVRAEADQQGPTEAQRILFAELERRYRSLQEAVCDELHEQMTNWQEDYPRE